ncbi:MAG: FtsW/RodA/SpoVE family cell cycle protein [Pelagibacteraceae bacterium]
MSFSRDSSNFIVKWIRSLDKTIVILLVLWITLGAIFSINSILGFASLKLYGDSKILINKYYIFISLGLLIICLSSIFNENFYKEFSKYFFFISLILLFLTLIIGVEAKGSKRWLNLFLFNLQPVELLKPSLIIFFASIFSGDKNFITKFLFSGLFTFVSVFILLLQPDYTQALIILIIWLTLIFMSGINLIIILLAVSVIISCMIFILFFFKENFSYIFIRFEKWIDNDNISYQSEKSLDAIQFGGFFGKGIGEGILKEKIPEAHTDYILAAISEEYGIISIILILLIIFFLFMRVFAICQREISNFKKYSLITLSTLVLLQVFINVGVTINLIPPTGMPFSFVSYGGSSIITSSFIMGIILSLTKEKYL